MTRIERFYRYALWLGFFTVFYNLLEGLISIFFGVHDEALTLFGFGIDSFIEVISGIGIIAMIYRIRRSPEIRAYFERIRQGNPERKKIALVATAHYLLRVMLAMLRTGEVWRASAA